jgi:hypothetical protein
VPTFTSSTIGLHMKKWLLGTAIFELVLAIGFAVAGFFVDDARGGFWVTAAILGIVSIGLILWGLRAGARAAEAKRIDQTGIAGTATVVGLTQTGLFVNENPQVEVDMLVQTPGRAPYQATRKEIVPLILLGRLSNGAPLPVKVDPADPSNVIIDWDAPAAAISFTGPGVTSAGPGPSLAPAGGQDETLAQVQQALAASGMEAAAPYATAEQAGYTVEQLRTHVRANGVAGTAIIDRVVDSGKTVGDERLMTMEVTVQVPGRQPHTTGPAASMVPMHAFPKVSVGKSIPVMVAADNPNVVLFEWDKL